MVLETPGSQVLERAQISSNPAPSPAKSGTLGRAQGLYVPTSSLSQELGDQERGG